MNRMSVCFFVHYYILYITSMKTDMVIEMPVLRCTGKVFIQYRKSTKWMIWESEQSPWQPQFPERKSPNIITYIRIGSMGELALKWHEDKLLFIVYSSKATWTLPAIPLFCRCRISAIMYFWKSTDTTYGKKMFRNPKAGNPPEKRCDGQNYKHKDSTCGDRITSLLLSHPQLHTFKYRLTEIFNFVYG